MVRAGRWALDASKTLLLPAILVESPITSTADLLDALWQDAPDTPAAPGTARHGREASAVGETYLRLLDVNLDDAEAILQFSNTYSVMGIYDTETGEFPFLPQRQSLWMVESDLKAGRQEANNALRAIEAASGAQPFVLGHATDDPSIEPLEEFRVAARYITDAVTAWRLLRDDLETGDSDWVSPLATMNTTTATVRARNSLTVAANLEAVVNSALTAVPPSLHVGTHKAIAPPRNAAPDAGLVAPAKDTAIPVVPLYAVCALELFNHIVENATYKRCQHEPCGRTFVRQSGRAAVGQYHRTGTKYCDHNCASAAKQRAHRRRKREATAP